MKTKLILGDCLQEMPQLEAKGINLILTDLPYGVTQNTADKCLPLDKLWNEWKRLLVETGIVVLTAQFPFTAELYNSNSEWFKYDLVWDKVLISGHLNANRAPLRSHENILVFYNKFGTYNPQKTMGQKNHSLKKTTGLANNNYGDFVHVDNSEILGNEKHPKSIIRISKPHASIALHPTEKPVPLAEWLIKTYTNEGDTVLDCCMGVGWTAVASKRLNRNFIGIEIDQSYFDTARHRMEKATLCLESFQLSESEGNKDV